MTPHQLLKDLSQLTPEFSAIWSDETNLHVFPDGRFTFAGVCSQFSNYFVDQRRFAEPGLVERVFYPTMTDDEMQRLFLYVEQHVRSVNDRSEELAGALTTCFLQNIAQTSVGAYARKFMGEYSRDYFDQWHV
jgi:hypothetical protein